MEVFATSFYDSILLEKHPQNISSCNGENLKNINHNYIIHTASYLMVFAGVIYIFYSGIKVNLEETFVCL